MNFQNWNVVLDKFKKCLNNWRGRNLSFYGKTEIINVAACSKLFYIGSFLSLPNTFYHDFERHIFDFLWGSIRECVKRQTLYLSKYEGGFGLVKLDCKIKALHLMHLKSLLYGPFAKWHTFAIYWTGLSLRKLRPDFASNSLLHSEKRPSFYCKLLESYRLIIEKYPDFELKQATTKSVYNILMSDLPRKPRIINVFPYIDFKQCWEEINCNFLHPYVKDLSWRIAHYVIPIDLFLYTKKLTKSKTCHFCDEEEKVEHLFYQCSVVQPVIQYVELLISAMASTPCKITAATMVFNNYCKSPDKYINVMFMYLTNELKKCIWMLRNKAKFDRKVIRTDDITYLFLHEVSMRCKVDFVRLHIDLFKQYWCKNDVICNIDGNKSLIINIP